MSKELRFPNVNNINISGHLTKDIELQYVGKNNVANAKLPIAFNRNFQKNGEWQQEVGYIDIVVWGKLAERCAGELHKGSPILAEGYLRQYSYQDKNDQKRYVYEIVSNKVSFLEKKDDYYSENGGEKVNEVEDDSGDVPF